MMRLIDGLHLGNVLIPERIKKNYIEALQISTKGLLGKFGRCEK